MAIAARGSRAARCCRGAGSARQSPRPLRRWMQARESGRAEPAGADRRCEDRVGRRGRCAEKPRRAASGPGVVCKNVNRDIGSYLHTIGLSRCRKHHLYEWQTIRPELVGKRYAVRKDRSRGDHSHIRAFSVQVAGRKLGEEGLRLDERHQPSSVSFHPRGLQRCNTRGAIRRDPARQKRDRNGQHRNREEHWLVVRLTPNKRPAIRRVKYNVTAIPIAVPTSA